MAEKLKSIKEPGATVYEFWIEANFQVLNLNPEHPYSHHTSYQMIASKNSVWITYSLDLKGMLLIQGK